MKATILDTHSRISIWGTRELHTVIKEDILSLFLSRSMLFHFQIRDLNLKYKMAIKEKIFDNEY